MKKWFQEGTEEDQTKDGRVEMPSGERRGVGRGGESSRDACAASEDLKC